MTEKKGHARAPTLSSPKFSLETLLVEELGDLLSAAQAQIEILRIEQPARSRRGSASVPAGISGRGSISAKDGGKFLPITSPVGGRPGTAEGRPGTASGEARRSPAPAAAAVTLQIDGPDTAREVSMLRVLREGPEEEDPPESSRDTGRAEVGFLQILREGPAEKEDDGDETSREISFLAALRSGPPGDAGKKDAGSGVLDVDAIRVRPTSHSASGAGAAGHQRTATNRLSIALSSAVAATVAASAGGAGAAGSDSRPPSRGGAASPPSAGPAVTSTAFLTAPEALEGKDEKARLEHWRAQRDKVSNKLQELVKKAATDEDQLAELFMQATKLLQRKQRKRREEKKVKMTEDAVVLHAQEVKRLLQHEYDLIKAAAPVRERAEAIVKLLADKKDPMEIPFEQRFAGTVGATDGGSGGEDEKCIIC